MVLLAVSVSRNKCEACVRYGVTLGPFHIGDLCHIHMVVYPFYTKISFRFAQMDKKSRSNLTTGCTSINHC